MEHKGNSDINLVGEKNPCWVGGKVRVYDIAVSEFELHSLYNSISD